MRRSGGIITQSRIAVLLWLFAHSAGADPLPDQPWLEALSLLAQSVRDQTVVVALPDGDQHLLELDEPLPGVYDLTLLSVLNDRVEIGATRPEVNDRRLRLWFTPGSPQPQLVSSLPPPAPGSIGPGSPAASKAKNPR